MGVPPLYVTDVSAATLSKSVYTFLVSSSGEGTVMLQLGLLHSTGSTPPGDNFMPHTLPHSSFLCTSQLLRAPGTADVVPLHCIENLRPEIFKGLAYGHTARNWLVGNLSCFHETRSPSPQNCVCVRGRWRAYVATRDGYTIKRRH